MFRYYSQLKYLQSNMIQETNENKIKDVKDLHCQGNSLISYIFLVLEFLDILVIWKFGLAVSYKKIRVSDYLHNFSEYWSLLLLSDMRAEILQKKTYQETKRTELPKSCQYLHW